MKDEVTNKLELLREQLHSSIVAKPKAYQEKENGSWSKLWSAFDNITDTQAAINQFLEENTGRIGIYGLLQSLVVQQDAIRHLQQSLALEPMNPWEIPDLKSIREIRNESIGHPTSTSRNKRSNTYSDGTISYTTASVKNLDKMEFEYIVWYKDRTEVKKINLKLNIKNQANVLNSVLDEISKNLTKIESAHLEKFANQSLERVLDESHYYISKLYSYESTRAYSKTCFDSLQKIYQSYKDNIIQRYGDGALSDYATIPGIVETIKHLDEVLPRIGSRVLLKNNQDKLELDVYIESADHSFQELRVYAKETDERFGAKL